MKTNYILLNIFVLLFLIKTNANCQTTTTESLKIRKIAITEYLKAMVDISNEKYDSAIVKFNSSLKSKPDFIEALEYRMICYGKLGKKDLENQDKENLAKIKEAKIDEEFIKDFKIFSESSKNIESDFHYEVYPNDDEGYFKRANEKSYDLKIKYLTKAIEINPNNFKYFKDRGFYYERTNYYSLAEKDYRKVVELNPKYELYEEEMQLLEKCNSCNGSGFTSTLVISKQKVNSKTKSSTNENKNPCTNCKNGKTFYYKNVILIREKK